MSFIFKENGIFMYGKKLIIYLITDVQSNEIVLWKLWLKMPVSKNKASLLRVGQMSSALAINYSNSDIN